MSDTYTYTDAHRAYFGLLTVMDPLRFMFWDSRDVTMTQLRVMFLIRDRCEPSTGELAEEMHIRPATLTGLADRLESKSLIRRWPDPTDRRVVRVGLTDAGTALLDEASAAGHTFLDAVFTRMGPEAIEAFICAANAFIAAAEAEHPAVPAPTTHAESPEPA
jgi:DNA-binding MarR family transcriptional regulator